MKKNQDKIITRREVANMLQASERTICRWVQQGLLTPIRLPLRKSIKGYKLSDIQQLIDDNDVKN